MLHFCCTSFVILSDGIAVEPTECKLYSPCDGKVVIILDTKHAVNLVSESGCEIILHIGIDTVKLHRQFFETHVSNGQQIKKGDLLITFDIDGIKNAGYKITYKITTPMVICNTDKFSSITPLASGDVSVNDKLIEAK